MENLNCMINGPVLERIVPGEFDAVIESARKAGEKDVWRNKIKGREQNPSGHLLCRDLLKYILAYLSDITMPKPKTTKRKKPNRSQKERLIILIDLVQKMQIQSGPQEGNFYKKWRDRNDNGYEPFNVVAFCMFNITIIWKEFQDLLPDKCRAQLLDMMLKSCKLVKNDNTPPKYTNMFLLNVFNLLQLGDILKDSRATAAGIARFDRFMLYTWEWGVHEYVSPAYTGVQLNVAMLLERYCVQKHEQAKALLTFYWVYVATNWIPHLKRLVGAESRQISDYLENEGNLNYVMQAMGLAGDKAQAPLEAIHSTFTQWRPSEALMAAADRRGLIRNSWGPLLNQSRTVCSLDDIALSVSGSAFDILAGGDRENYGVLPQGAYAESEDVLLAADFRDYTQLYGIEVPDPNRFKRGLDLHVSGRSLVDRYPGRMYFLPDANNDPYGEKDSKHLAPTAWAATQTFVDALNLALYAPNNPDDPDNSGEADGSLLYSHFVLPMVLNTWVGEKSLAQLKGLESLESHKQLGNIEDLEPREMNIGESVVLFYKNQIKDGDKNSGKSKKKKNKPGDLQTYTALGVKVLWAGDLAGENIEDPKKIMYHFEEAGDMPVMRLTVDHSVPGKATGTAGVLAWVRVGSNLTKERCMPWREEFKAAVPDTPYPYVERDPIQKKQQGKGKFEAITKVCVDAIDVTGGHLGICTKLCDDDVTYHSTVMPPFSQSVLEWDYEDVGRECLRTAPLITRYERSYEGVERVFLPEMPLTKDLKDQKTVHWEAEQGQIWLPMVAGWEKSPNVTLTIPPTSKGKTSTPVQYVQPEELGHWFVWMNPDSVPNWQQGSDVGNVGWRLVVPETGGKYYMWARVKTFKKKAGAFMVRIFQGRDQQSLVFQAPWELGSYSDWSIVPLVLGPGAASDQKTPPSKLKLPPGELSFQLFALRWGTKIDCLYAATSPHLPLECLPESDRIKKITPPDTSTK